MASHLRIEKVTRDNVRAACGLELRPGQETLVAPVAWSLAEAYTAPEIAWPRLVYDGDELVGFLMAAFAAGHENDIYHSYLWRLNISGAAQGRGYGRFAVAAAAAEATRRGQRRLTVSWLDEPHGPERFYLRLGFRSTGEVIHGEIVGELPLDRAQAVPPGPQQRDPES